MTQDVEQRAKDAGLRYVSDETTKGYSRKRAGTGFAYYEPCGQLLSRESAIRRWIDTLAIPPAWDDVWVSPTQQGHVLAMGRDSAGRKQYIYHPLWNELARETVFYRLPKFADALSTLRDQVDADLARDTLDRRLAIAAVVRLMDRGLVRVGNENSYQQRSAFGATTLECKHVELQDGCVLLDFVAKGGKGRAVAINDPKLTDVLAQCQELPGQRLFQYRSANGPLERVYSDDVNEYMHTVAGDRFTAKDFRTWGGSTRFCKYACDLLDQEQGQDRETVCRNAEELTAKSLNNTPNIARSHYIHSALRPAVLEKRLDQFLSQEVSKTVRKRLARHEWLTRRLLD